MTDIEEFFGEGGALSAIIEGYRPRPGQIALAKAVQSSLEDKKHLIAEGPTGTGKSMAYGIPAAIHALTTGERVVIVTANINLQEQLVNKDLPTIAKIFRDHVQLDGAPIEFYFSLMKGMNNYLCVNSYEEALENEEFKGQEWLREIRKWAGVTKTGDKSELKKEYPPAIWGNVSTTSDECLRFECPHFDDCYVFSARDIGDSHVIVTNYHMLFTDILVRNMTLGRGGLLPEYQVLVMDEVHRAADIAMDYQGFRITAGSVLHAARMLKKIEQGDKPLSLLRATVNELFVQLDGKLQAKESILTEPLGFDGDVIHALTQAKNVLQNAAGNISGSESSSAAVLKKKLQLGGASCRKMAKKLESVCFGEMGEPEEPEVQQLELPIETPDEEEEEQAEPLELSQSYVYYLEKEKGKVAICAKAMNTQSFFRTNIFSKATVIMTSATLSVGNSFRFVADELGLRDDEYASLIAPSPFDFSNMLAAVPRKQKFPSDKDENFAATVGFSIASISRQLKSGGVLALFTSHKNMKAAAIAASAAKIDASIYVQEELSKQHIIESFKSDYQRGKKAIIFATQSFWEGVDIPGQALSVLTIDKIPFATPDNPVIFHIDRMGDDAFIGYSVPKATIALKQGVGRLIRRETDYGGVVIFDSRLLHKYSYILDSVIPEKAKLDDDFMAVVDFINSREKKA